MSTSLFNKIAFSRFKSMFLSAQNIHIDRSFTGHILTIRAPLLRWDQSIEWVREWLTYHFNWKFCFELWVLFCTLVGTWRFLRLLKHWRLVSHSIFEQDAYGSPCLTTNHHTDKCQESLIKAYSVRYIYVHQQQHCDNGVTKWIALTWLSGSQGQGFTRRVSGLG